VLPCLPGVEVLRQLTLRLLDEATPPEDLARICVELHGWFTDAAPLDSSPSEAGRLPTGLALPPDLAAQCILDSKRTVAFVRGLFLALAEARRRFTHGEIEVVYAGTGPFAPLVLPLMTAQPLPGVVFTFIDFHRRATDAVQELIARLGLGKRARRVTDGDATSYNHPTPIHVVLTETLQRSLDTEPFVGIVRNLRRQLAPGGLVVPERVAVDVALIDAASQQAQWSGTAPAEQHESLARLFEVTAQGEFPPLDKHGRSEAVVVIIPEGRPHLERWIALITRVDVFGTIRLREHESGLTVPQILWPLSPAHGGDVLEFCYILDKAPGLRWTRL